MNIRTYPKPPALGNAWAKPVCARTSGRACQQRDGATLPIRIAKQALHVNQCAVRKPVCRAGVIDRLCRQSMRCAVPDLADSGCDAHEEIRASHSTTGAKYEACNPKKADAWNSARTGAICRETRARVQRQLSCNTVFLCRRVPLINPWSLAECGSERSLADIWCGSGSEPLIVKKCSQYLLLEKCSQYNPYFYLSRPWPSESRGVGNLRSGAWVYGTTEGRLHTL
jgi:hypothetical protein